MSMMTAIHAISLPAQDEDEFLMLRFGRGEIRAFEQLYQRHRGGLFRFFMLQISNPELAEDLYQETWRRLIKSAPAYEVSASFACWLYRIAHNLLTEHARAVTSLHEALQWQQAKDGATSASTLANDADNGRQRRALRESLSLLPQVQKEAFVLCAEMGFSAEAISDIAAISLEAAQHRIRSAYERMQSSLGGYLEGDGYED